MFLLTMNKACAKNEVILNESDSNFELGLNEIKVGLNDLNFIFERKCLMKKNKKRIIINCIIYLILICILIYSSSKIFVWYKDNKNTKEIEEKINESVTVEKNEQNQEEYNVDFTKLKAQNNETVAWLKVNNTNIEYPVVKAKDNDFYLTRSFDKSNNSVGWIFADYKNKFDGTDKNIVVYGHNRRDGSMFGTLKNILQPDWYNNEDNLNVMFNVENENCIYRVFSVYQIEKEDYYITTNFNNNDEFEIFLKTIKKRSIKDFGIEVSKDDTILTLSTCANNNKYRVVLHAKKIQNANN